MKKAAYDMLYLTACGIHGIVPAPERIKDIELEKLYRMCCLHFVDALVGTTLKKAGIVLTKAWTDSISKAIRKQILFDAERAEILKFMESRGIWYLPLKGIVLKEFYPAVGMRQMSDNDILFDGRFASDIQSYMTGRGYKPEGVGKGNHDAYCKPPVYNFEMHRSLYGTEHGVKWRSYYENVKERLIKTPDTEYGYCFSDEDFYVYIITHEYKHYSGGGTGLRSLLDVYVYLQAKERQLDFDYIKRECSKLDVAEFEEQGRALCKKIFSQSVAENAEEINNILSVKEKEMLEYYLTSGVYGTTERMMENRVEKFRKETGSNSKLRYLWKRIFPDMNKYREFYPFFYKHKWLLPVGWLYRAVRALVDGRRRRNMQKELQAVREKR